MPLNFPNSPSIGATYSPPGVSKSWIYTGEQWSAITAPIEEGASVTVSDTPPSGASAGDLWFDSSSGVTSVRYDSSWIDVGGGDSGTSAGSVNGIVKADGAGNFSAAVAGTDYLTSATLGSSPQAARAWANFNGDIAINATATLVGSNNVSSVVRRANGGTPDSSVIYRINFATPMASTRYVVLACGQIGGDGGAADDQIAGNRGITFQTTDYCEIGIRDPQSSNEVSTSVGVVVFSE